MARHVPKMTLQLYQTEGGGQHKPDDSGGFNARISEPGATEGMRSLAEVMALFEQYERR